MAMSRRFFLQLSGFLMTGLRPPSWGISGDPADCVLVNWSEYLYASVKHNSRLGRVIEGPLDDRGGTITGFVAPRPMLLWSTGEVLHRRADAACDFLQEALHLEEYEDWRVQRCAFRTAIEWFFSNAHGRAWIAAVPNKPGSGEALKACGAKYLSSSLVGECLGLGKRVRNVKDLGIGLPPLPIKGFRFAYRTAKHPRTEFVVRPWERELLTRAGGKYVERQRDLFTANPIEDEKLIHDGLYMLEPDAIYDSVRRRYKTPHIWLSKVPLFAPKSVTQLCLVLQRDTAQMIGIATYRRALDSLLLQQPIDRGMLGAAGAIL